MSGITKTIPQKEGIEALNVLYDGSISEFEFHMAGKPSRLDVGQYVYTIYDDQLHGRLRITKLVTGAVNPDSGKTRTLIYVAAPGERLAKPLPYPGHRGTRYYDGGGWPVGS
ncbi:MAG: hypothetical protein OEZ02_13690 [Anaerolineae bacterium]|nr:hypothetical protein [Anaerolineae bacterium]